MKWLLYLAAGFLLAAALHFARPAASALEQPLQVRGFHIAREILFALGFLLVVLLLSEPFLAQESQRVVLPFRLRLPTVGSVVAAGTSGGNRSIMNQLSLLTLLLFFVLQALIYLACLFKLAEIRRQSLSPRIKLKLLDNEDHLFDAGLYLGFAGTIISLILVSLGVIQPSLMAAYSSTSFGIIFVSVFKIFHLRGVRRKLLLEAEAAHTGISALGRCVSVRHAIMNRSILIVICDFLLVSLLAFSTADINKTTNEGVPRQVKVDIAANQNQTRQDLAAVMRLALEQEHQGREMLRGELAKTRETASRQQALLNEREQQVQTFRQELQQKEQQTVQLVQQQTNLLQQFNAAQAKQQALLSEREQQVQAYRQELQQKEQQAAQLEQQQTNLLQQFAAAEAKQQALLSEREQQVQAYRQELEQKAQEAAQLEQQHTNLLQQFTAAQTNQQGLLSEREKQVQAYRQELERKGQQTAQLEQQQTNLLQQLTAAQAKQQALLSERDKQVQAYRQELERKAQQAAQLEQQQSNLLQQLTAAQAKQQELLSDREKQVQAFRQELQQKELQTARLQQRQADLQQQFAAAQTNIQTLGQQLHSSSTDALISKEKLAAMQAELRRQAEQAAALQAQLGQLAKTNQLVLTEKQRLAGQLLVAEAEKRMATEQATRMQEEVNIERAEKAKLADGVKALASRSDFLAAEIRGNRALAPNTIFNQLATNRVQATLWASRVGFLGMESNKRSEIQTVLATDGTNTVALCHVQDTPLTFGYPGTEWEGLTGSLGHNTTFIPIRSLSFYQLDPRIVLIPLTQTEVRALGCQAYRTSSDPYKFQDALVVGAQEGYYGECNFQIDLTTPLYVKMDHNSIKGLFGKFNPSRGDLVFSRTGELLGVMANSTYCMMIKNFNATATFHFAQDVRNQQTGETLARLYSLIARLPYKLQ